METKKQPLYSIYTIVLSIAIAYIFSACASESDKIDPKSRNFTPNRSARTGSATPLNSGSTLEQRIASDPAFAILTTTYSRIMSKANSAIRKVPIFNREAHLNALVNTMNNNPTNAQMEEVVAHLGYTSLAEFQNDNQVVDNALNQIFANHFGGNINPTQSQITPLITALNTFYNNSSVLFPSAYVNNPNNNFTSSSNSIGSLEYSTMNTPRSNCLPGFVSCVRATRKSYALNRSMCFWNIPCQIVNVIGYAINSHMCSMEYDVCAGL